MLKKQKFGVEIEMTGITREQAANIVAQALNSTSSEADRTCYYTRKIKDNSRRIWKIMRDSSISPRKKEGAAGDEYRVELVTPPLNYNDIELLQQIVRDLRNSGAMVNSSCGIHIHVDGANHTPHSLRRLVNFMISRQDLIYESLEIGSRASRWCLKLSSDLLTEMKKKKEISREQVETIWYSPNNDDYFGGIDHTHYNRTRYHGINLHSYFSKGTVEFRLFNSTLHAGKIKAYIQFCLALSAWAIESDDRIVFRSMDGYSAQQKVTIMRNILTQRLGLSGEEFKTCRLHIMTPLKKIAAEAQAAA